MWLPITEFLSTPVYFLNPDPDMTLTEPSMAPEVLSVSTYNAENNSFYAESGRGFGRTGQIRPDLSAPGVNISTIDGCRTGSSMAAAITAGAVAQFSNGQSLKAITGWRKAGRSAVISYAVPCVHRV